MAREGTVPLNMNIRKDLLERIEKYRFRRMFRTKTEAIEHLLEVALKANPKKADDRDEE